MTPYTLNMDFKVNEEDISSLTSKTKELVGKQISEMSEKLKESVFDDIENWMEERSENTFDLMFDYITSYLLGKDNRCIPSDRKEKMDNLLNGIGYDAETFRERIYKENKEDIITSIKYEKLYEEIKNMADRYGFKIFKYKDIKMNYPQSEIIRGFAKYIINEVDVKEYLMEGIDKEIKDKLEYLKNLKSKINEANELLEDN